MESLMEGNQAMTKVENTMTTTATVADWIDAQELTGPRYQIETRDYADTDYLAFARRLIAEAVMDKLYYLEHGRNDGRSGSHYRLDRARQRAQNAMRAHTQDELSTEELRQAFDEVASHEAELTFVQAEMAALQELYRTKLSADGEDYTPYGQRAPRGVRKGNVAAAPDALPDDLAAMAKALKIA